MDRVGFGVGCLPVFPAGIPDAELKPTSRTWWAEQIQDSLGSLPSVTNLIVDISQIGLRIPRRNDILLTSGEYDVDHSPSPSDPSVVKFNIVIPRRMQEEVHPWGRESYDCENFEVMTEYGRYGPVTFVRPLEGSMEQGRVAFLVAMVREFLKQEFSRTGAALAVKATGPSPFWAHFMIRPRASAEDDSEDVVWISRTRAYDLVCFRYDSNSESAAEAYDRVRSYLLEQLSLYYFLTRSRDRRRERAQIVRELTHDLIQVHDASGVRAWLRRIFKSSGLAKELLLAVIMSKQVGTEELRKADEILITELEAEPLPEIRKKLAERATVSNLSELETAHEIATILESRRKIDYEVIMLSTATALGGAAGAIAALLAG